MEWTKGSCISHLLSTIIRSGNLDAYVQLISQLDTYVNVIYWTIKRLPTSSTTDMQNQAYVNPSLQELAFPSHRAPRKQTSQPPAARRFSSPRRWEINTTALILYSRGYIWTCYRPGCDGMVRPRWRCSTCGCFGGRHVREGMTRVEPLSLMVCVLPGCG